LEEEMNTTAQELQQLQQEDDHFAIIEYDVTDAALAELKAKYANMPMVTKADYKALMAGISETLGLRTGVEKHRKMLKADSLAWGRRVDAEAKRITAALVKIEQPMKDLKAAEDARVAEEAAEKARQAQKRIDDLKAREEEDARLAKEREAIEAEKREMAEKQKAAAAKLEEERRAIAAEQEKIRKDQEEQQRAIDEEKARLQAIEDAKKAEEAEAQRIADQEQAEKEETARRAALLPDKEKLLNLAVVTIPRLICSLQDVYDTLTSEEGKALLEMVGDDMAILSEDMKMRCEEML